MNSVEQYNKIAFRAEELAFRDPRAYRVRLLLLAAAGYAYIFLVLALLVGLCAGIVYLSLATRHFNGIELKIVVVLGIGIVLLVRSLFVEIKPPEGVVLQRSDAPRLFETIEEVRRAVQAPAPDCVQVDGLFNASIAQVPRLGLFGWYENYLTIGLPLMMSLPPDEFRAVIAHEFGHLSGAHGKIGTWLYRVRQTWGQIAETFTHRGGMAGMLLLPFFRRFVPHFSAYSLAQMRLHEYEADACSANAAGVAPAARALVRINMIGCWLDEMFWPSIYHRVHAEPKPPAPYACMARAAETARSTEFDLCALRRALFGQPDGMDTHPTLAKRLAALTGRPAPEEPADVELLAATASRREGPSAADVLLGPALPGLVAQLDTRWQSGIAPQWTARNADAQKEKAELAALNARASAGPLAKDDAWKRSVLTETLEGAAAALPLFQAVASQWPDHVGARFATARLLLARRNAAGVALMESVIRDAPDSAGNAAALLDLYYRDTGQAGEARAWHQRLITEYDLQRSSEDERSGLKDSDQFEPHGLRPELSAEIVRRVKLLSTVKTAWLVRKRIKVRPEQPCYVLAVERAVRRLSYESGEVAEQAVQTLLRGLVENLQGLDLDLRVFVVPGNHAAIGKFKRVPGSKVI